MIEHASSCKRPAAAEFKGTVVAVTHDRYFLDNVAGWILELDRGQGIPFEGNYSEWLKAKAKRLEVATDKHLPLVIFGHMLCPNQALCRVAICRNHKQGTQAKLHDK
jgi:hypothetical protein